MNKAERRRNKINNCLMDLFYLYMADKKPIVATVSMLGMHYKLTFSAEDLNAKVDNQEVPHE